MIRVSMQASTSVPACILRIDISEEVIMFFDQYSEELTNTMNAINREDIKKLESLLNEARVNGKHVFILGNGGSAAAASHWVCDFGKGINVNDSKRMKIFAPSDHTSIFTAYGNDNAYDATLTEQIKNFLEPGDLVISLSVSGSSGNLVDAHRYAREAGATTVCIVGDYNGKLIGMSDFPIVINSKNYGVVEDIHIILEHAISQDIKRLLQSA